MRWSTLGSTDMRQPKTLQRATRGTRGTGRGPGRLSFTRLPRVQGASHVGISSDPSDPRATRHMPYTAPLLHTSARERSAQARHHEPSHCHRRNIHGHPSCKDDEAQDDGDGGQPRVYGLALEMLLWRPGIAMASDRFVCAEALRGAW